MVNFMLGHELSSHKDSEFFCFFFCSTFFHQIYQGKKLLTIIWKQANIYGFYITCNLIGLSFLKLV